MEFNGVKITQYKDGRDAATGTLARGSTFNNEFTRLYDNDNYLKGEIDKLGGASIDTDDSLSSNSDVKIPSQKAAKAYVDGKISDLIGGAPALLDTLNEIAAALGNDANLATTLLDKIYSSSQRDLVFNGDFRYFNSKIGTANWYDYKSPDRWVYIDNGTDGKIGYDIASLCCKIQSSSDGSGSRILKQDLHGFFNWQKYLSGAVFTLKIFIKGSAGVIVKITDGIDVTSKALVGTGAIETVEITTTLNSNLTALTVSVEIPSSSSVLEIYKVNANRGKNAVEDTQTNNAETLNGYSSSDITPIGTIVSYLPGYFTGGANAGFTPVGLSIPGNWKVCDGSLCNDPDSLIFNGAGRYLPNLTDSRFIMGSTIANAGQIGGNASNQVSLVVGNLPSHNHTNEHTHTFSGTTAGQSVTHNHTRNPAGASEYTIYPAGGSYGALAGAQGTGTTTVTGNASVDHTHSYSGTTSGASASTGFTGSGTAFSILPKYLTAAYIMRIK